MSKLEYFDENEISILIVEDEPVLAIGMEFSLESMGYNVSGIESSGRSAIKHVEENSPDIVLMDINLKGAFSGIDAAKEIWLKKKTPIIFITSYSDTKTIKKAMACEPYGYLVKPCKDEEINATIQTTIHKHNFFFKNKEYLLDEKSDFVQIKENIKYQISKSTLYINNEPQNLTGNERKFMDILCATPKESVSFDKINTYIWREPLYDLGKLRTLVYRLRSKIKVDLFENVYESGYKLKLDE